MADALRAAQGVPAFPRRVVGASGRDQPGAARRAGDDARARDVRSRGTADRGGAGRALHRHRQRVLRRAAGPSGRQGRDGWHERMVGIVDDRLAFVVSPDALPGTPDDRMRRSARSSNGAHDQPIALAGAAHRAPRRRGADHRLRPRRERLGDTLAGGARPQLRRSARRAGRGRPHRAGRFRGARAHRAARRARRRTVRSRRASSCAASASRQRAARLQANATPQQAAEIDAALARLTAGGPDGRAVQGAGDRRIRSARARCPGFDTASASTRHSGTHAPSPVPLLSQHPPRLLHARGRRVGGHL